MAERIPAEVFPPGEFIKDELEARGWSQVDLAEVLGRPPRLVSEIIAGKRTITPETARGLAAAFGTDAQLWLNLESAYQLSRLKQNDDVVARRARLYAMLPMKDMVRRHWIESTDNIEVLEQRVKSFMKIDDLTEETVSDLKAAARASTIEPTSAQAAWVARARQLAGMVSAVKFSASHIATAVQRLKMLFPSAPEIRHVPRILAEAGIRIVIVETLPQSRIDGACFWLDSHSPVIALSLRFDRIDAFWFTLMHELGHVKNGDGISGDPPIDIDLVGEQAQRSEDKAEAEKKADEFASETILPSADIRNFIARVRPLYSKSKIIGLAQRLQIHPGVVVGRLQFMREIPYTHSRDMLEKVRGIITSTALTDGWGSIVALTSQEKTS